MFSPLTQPMYQDTVCSCIFSDKCSTSRLMLNVPSEPAAAEIKPG